MASASLYGGLGAVPPAESRGRAPSQGGKAPLKLKAFWCRREQICHSHLVKPKFCSYMPKRNRNGVPAQNEPWTCPRWAAREISYWGIVCNFSFELHTLMTFGAKIYYVLKLCCQWNIMRCFNVFCYTSWYVCISNSIWETSDEILNDDL